jgi:hypothetical protein
MNEISRVIPASDYIDAVPAQDVIVKAWPCIDCEHYDHCKVTGEECQAWRDYNSERYSSGPWHAEDRVPFGLRDKARLAAMVDKFVQRKGAVMHNGHQFVKGSLSERVYLVIGELGVATNADVAAVLTERGVAFSPRSLKTTTQRMNARGQLKKLPRCMWSWG